MWEKFSTVYENTLYFVEVDDSVVWSWSYSEENDSEWKKVKTLGFFDEARPLVSPVPIIKLDDVYKHSCYSKSLSSSLVESSTQEVICSAKEKNEVVHSISGQYFSFSAIFTLGQK